MPKLLTFLPLGIGTSPTEATGVGQVLHGFDEFLSPPGAAELAHCLLLKAGRHAMTATAVVWRSVEFTSESHFNEVHLTDAPYPPFQFILKAYRCSCLSSFKMTLQNYLNKKVLPSRLS